MLYLLVFLAGALLPVQAGINGELARHLGHPLRASLVSFLVGSLFLFLLVQRLAPGAWGGVEKVPFWAWLGGIGGALYVWSIVALAPRLGALISFALLVAGQMAASMALEALGLLYPARPVTFLRLLGVLLLVLGVVLIRRY
ncbi:DMT family transporter [Thermus thermophilus]|uniref:DMT family transporter n=1 Tax=Thermus thermophilus TaxID=274 RepID=UPI0003D7A7A2|nr:DMT family transporter [Thermus thermophilus]